MTEHIADPWPAHPEPIVVNGHLGWMHTSCGGHPGGTVGRYPTPLCHTVDDFTCPIHDPPDDVHRRANRRRRRIPSGVPRC